MTREMLKALSAPAYRTTLGAIRHFAFRIAELPPEQRGQAIAAAERFFAAMLRQFGHTEEDAQRWNTMMIGALWQLVFESSIDNLIKSAKQPREGCTTIVGA
jgi:hypothetical protein